jgi:hypothetical protein
MPLRDEPSRRTHLRDEETKENKKKQKTKENKKKQKHIDKERQTNIDKTQN